MLSVRKKAFLFKIINCAECKFIVTCITQLIIWSILDIIQDGNTFEAWVYRCRFWTNWNYLQIIIYFIVRLKNVIKTRIWQNSTKSSNKKNSQEKLNIKELYNQNEIFNNFLFVTNGQLTITYWICVRENLSERSVFFWVLSLGFHLLPISFLILDLIFFIKISTSLKREHIKYFVMPGFFCDFFYFFHFCLWYFNDELVYSGLNYDDFTSLLAYLASGAIILAMGILHIWLKRHIRTNMRQKITKKEDVGLSLGIENNPVIDKLKRVIHGLFN